MTYKLQLGRSCVNAEAQERSADDDVSRSCPQLEALFYMAAKNVSPKNHHKNTHLSYMWRAGLRPPLYKDAMLMILRVRMFHLTLVLVRKATLIGVSGCSFRYSVPRRQDNVVDAKRDGPTAHDSLSYRACMARMSGVSRTSNPDLVNFLLTSSLSQKLFDNIITILPSSRHTANAQP